ncbi:DUF6086 family protein [Streptomyces sp. NPDC045251]|uniref:DUF6086 family protein n=1 Tax=unclassified Streptomyces TaxID=2593676 RepID=UPI0033D2815E
MPRRASTSTSATRHCGIRISPGTFETLVNALLAQHRRTHHWLALSEGFTATVLVLAERAAIKVDWGWHGAAPDQEADRPRSLRLERRRRNEWRTSVLTARFPKAVREIEEVVPVSESTWVLSLGVTVGR